MKTSARPTNAVVTGSAARRLAAVATALVVTLGPGFLSIGHAAGVAELSIVDRFVSAAYFSEACRHEPERLGIDRTTDPQFLLSAFAQSLAAEAPDVRAERRAVSFDARSQSVGCDLPAVALINLLQLNGIAAELALVSVPRAEPAFGPAFSDRVDEVVVYVPALGRYVDPAATDSRANATFDRVIAETAVRTHLIGPAPGADPAIDACGGVCMRVYSPRRNPYVARVKTEAIRGLP
jgi:hypothetical protein